MSFWLKFSGLSWGDMGLHWHFSRPMGKYRIMREGLPFCTLICHLILILGIIKLFIKAFPHILWAVITTKTSFSHHQWGWLNVEDEQCDNRWRRNMESFTGYFPSKTRGVVSAKSREKTQSSPRTLEIFKVLLVGIR